MKRLLLLIAATGLCNGALSHSQDLPLTKTTPRGLELSEIDIIVVSKRDNHKVISKLKTRMNQLLKQVSDLTPQELFELSDIQYELRELTKKH